MNCSNISRTKRKGCSRSSVSIFPWSSAPAVDRLHAAHDHSFAVRSSRFSFLAERDGELDWTHAWLSSASKPLTATTHGMKQNCSTRSRDC